MNLTEACELARRGTKMTRPAWHDAFFLYSDGKLLRGSYLGESSFTDMHAYAFTDEDRQSADWEPYVRTLPDDWEGCEILIPPAEQIKRWEKN